MAKYLLRLDDACRFMNLQSWLKLEELFDNYNIKPIVAIIPRCKDETLIFQKDLSESGFWEIVNRWAGKGWTIALHGFEHIYVERMGWSYVPIWKKTEFAGLPIEVQAKKIKEGYKIFLDNGIKPTVWVAPAHTFDKNTLKVLYEETDIRIVSDCFAFDVFYEENMYFIPQQLWKFRKMPFGLWTICLHPNNMNHKEIDVIEKIIKTYRLYFISLHEVKLKKREWSLVEKFLNFNIWFNVLPKVKSFIKRCH